MFSYSASRAWPQLFPSHRRIPLQTKRNIADEQMCFKNGRSTRPPVCLPGGFTHQHGSWRVRMELDANTQGELITTCVNTHVQTHWQRYAETCIHTHTQIWIFYVQIIKERWLQTERTHCCRTWTNTWWRTKMYRARQQVSPPKTEKKKPFQTTLFWNWLIKRHSQPHAHIPTGNNLVCVFKFFQWCLSSLSHTLWHIIEFKWSTLHTRTTITSWFRSPPVFCEVHSNRINEACFFWFGNYTFWYMLTSQQIYAQKDACLKCTSSNNVSNHDK